MTLRLWATLFLTFVLAACGDPKFMDKTKIDGSILRGTPVLRGDKVFGRTVYIAKNFTFDPSHPSLFQKFGLCTGVIIHERYILTAAHCTQNIADTRVIFTEDVNQPLATEQIYRIQDYDVPVEYSKARNSELDKNIAPGPLSRSNRYDLAVLKLDRPITGAQFSMHYFNQPNSFIHLAESDRVDMTIPGFVAGYGRISEYNRIQNDPRFLYANSPIALNGTLMKAKINFTLTDLANQVISRSQRYSPGVCGGDSGAPVFIERDGQDYLQAIAIATFKIKDEDPENIFNNCYGESLFLNLDFHKKWIYETMLRLQKRKTIVAETAAI